MYEYMYVYLDMYDVYVMCCWCACALNPQSFSHSASWNSKLMLS